MNLGQTFIRLINPRSTQHHEIPSWNVSHSTYKPSFALMLLQGKGTIKAIAQKTKPFINLQFSSADPLLWVLGPSTASIYYSSKVSTSTMIIGPFDNADLASHIGWSLGTGRTHMNSMEPSYHRM